VNDSKDKINAEIEKIKLETMMNRERLARISAAFQKEKDEIAAHEKKITDQV
jgi:hypothetical protein